MGRLTGSSGNVPESTRTAGQPVILTASAGKPKSCDATNRTHSMGIAVPSTIWLDQSGPGLLVSWRLNSSLNQSEDILQYVVLRARWPSPSFYELQSACCPMTPSQSRPCCPVQASRTSLQVEGLEDGVPFRFKIIAMLRDHQNETIGPSQ